MLGRHTLIGRQKPEGILVIAHMHGTPDWPQALLPYEGECCCFLQRHAKGWATGQGGLPLLPAVVVHCGIICQCRAGGKGVH